MSKTDKEKMKGLEVTRGTGTAGLDNALTFDPDSTRQWITTGTDFSTGSYTYDPNVNAGYGGSNTKRRI